MTAPFFIVGNDRSGTTMLRLILDRSREAAVPSESMLLRDFAHERRRGRLGEPGEAERFLAAVWRHPKVRLWKLEGEPPPVPPGLGHAEAYRFAVEAPFRAYARSQGKDRFGDKTPAYLHCVDELFDVWPEARVVVLVRDGRDVALSLRGVPFGPNNVWSAARWWARGIRRGLEAERRHPGAVLHVRYEDLCTEPERVTLSICDFLELAYHPGMLAIERSDPAKIVEDQSGWFTSVWSGINADAIGKWRRELTARERSTFATVAGAELAELRYEVDEADRVSRLPEAWYRVHNAALRVVNLVRLRVVQERGRELRFVLERRLRRL